jgi:pyruvate dehydrogenase E1 component alpha subunit
MLHSAIDVQFRHPHIAVCKLVFVQQSSHHPHVRSCLSTKFSSKLRKLVSEFGSTRGSISLRFRIVQTFMAAHPDETIFEAQAKTHRPLLTLAQHQRLISDDKLKQLFAEMLRVRQHGKAASSSRARKQSWKFQEASLVGTTIDLRAEDSLISSLSLPNNTVAQRAVLEADSVVVLATGAALLHRLQAKGNLAVAFVDANDIARNHSVLRIAHVRSLPIIYVQVERVLPKTTRRHTQIRSIPVDKTDVVAIYRVASEAIDKARRGAGPTLIQCVPFLLRKNSSTNHDSQDPIRYMEYYLRKKNLWR